MTKEELHMRKLVRESDIIDKTDGSELAKAFNHLWEKYIETKMTNREKFEKEFEKLFGFLPKYEEACPILDYKDCDKYIHNHPACEGCPYGDWWDKDYDYRKDGNFENPATKHWIFERVTCNSTNQDLLEFKLRCPNCFTLSSFIRHRKDFPLSKNYKCPVCGESFIFGPEDYV